MQTKFFKSPSDFRRWLEKNHAKSSGILVGIRKGNKAFTQTSAVDQAICFGWIFSVIKKLDEYSYTVQFVPRKAKSQWSAGMLKRAETLKKKGLMRPAGLASLKNRERHKLETGKAQFTSAQLKKFKANKKAWDYFLSMTPSYRHYTTAWVITAKREETQTKRLDMLIKDSAKEQKLERIAKAIEKVTPKYPAGQTPIEAGKNLGPVTGAELRSVGIETVESLKSIGWEKAFYRLCEMYPHRVNLNMLNGLIGTVNDVDWRKLDPEMKAEARVVLREVKESIRT